MLQDEDTQIDQLLCANFASGDAKDLHALAWNARRGAPDDPDLPDKKFTVPGRGCKRVSCWNTSGLYVSPLLSRAPSFSGRLLTSIRTMQVCNDRDEARELTYSEVCNAVDREIIEHCCVVSQHWVSYHRAVSGQLFSKDGYNIIAGYANCNKADDFRPGDYALPGPNGWCK